MAWFLDRVATYADDGPRDLPQCDVQVNGFVAIGAFGRGRSVRSAYAQGSRSDAFV
jgi:hypothetical protein